MCRTIKTKLEFEAVIDESLKEKSVWQLANGILYDLCKKHHSHKNTNEIIAKVWLVGRSYAASLERKRESDELSDPFYEKTLAKAVKSHSVKIDGAIKVLLEKPKNFDDKNVFAAYWAVLECFHEASKIWNVSLASKYLHFHCPDIFFLYDSRAASAIGKVVKFLGEKNIYKENEIDGFISCKDEDAKERMRIYIKFYLKCKACMSKIEKTFGKKLSIKDFDNLLLKIKDDGILLKENVI